MLSIAAGKIDARRAYGKPTGVYKGRNQAFTHRDRIFCINGFRESFSADEAERHNLTHNTAEDEAASVPDEDSLPATFAGLTLTVGDGEQTFNTYVNSEGASELDTAGDLGY